MALFPNISKRLTKWKKYETRSLLSSQPTNSGHEEISHHFQAQAPERHSEKSNNTLRDVAPQSSTKNQNAPSRGSPTRAKAPPRSLEQANVPSRKLTTDITCRTHVDAEKGLGRKQEHEELKEERVAEEMRTQMKSLEELFEDFKTRKTPESQDYGVVQYVEVLRSKNEAHVERCSNAEMELEERDIALRNIRDKMMSLIHKLHPEAIDKMSRGGSPTTSTILGFLLTQYEGLYNEIGKLEIRIRDLERQMLDQKSSHENEVARIKADCRNQIQYAQSSHAREKARLKENHEKEVDDQQNRHDKQITDMASGYEERLYGRQTQYDREIAELVDGYEKRLDDQKATLENEKGILLKGLSNAANRFQPTPDSEFQNRFKDLKGLVGTLARSPMDVDGTTLGQAFDQPAFVQYAPRRHHKFLLESSLWVILMEGIFSTPFKVFGDYGEHLAATWGQLFQSNGDSRQSAFNWPPADALSEKWRCATFEPLLRALSHNTENDPATSEIQKSCQRNVLKVARSLSEALSRISFQDRQADIRTIVDKACSLALDFGMQQCRIHVFAARTNDTVSNLATDSYKAANGEDNSDRTTGIIQFVVSPGLRKTGDGRGGSMDLEQSTVLCPAALYLKTSHD